VCIITAVGRADPKEAAALGAIGRASPGNREVGHEQAAEEGGEDQHDARPARRPPSTTPAGEDSTTPAPHPSLEQAVRRGGRALGCSVRRLRKGAESAPIAALGMGSSAHRDACISEEPALEL
jgi:hypothetical protein